MAIHAIKNEQTPREKPKAGTVQAVCTAVRDIGLQEENTIKGTKLRHKIVVLFEIAQTMTTGEFTGKRFIVSQKFTLTMWENGNLRPFIESWFAKKFPDEDTACKFDLENLIGKNCLLSLIPSKCGKYINIGSVSPIMVGMVKMTPELKPDHLYKWIDELAVKAIKQEAQHGEPAGNPVVKATADEVAVGTSDGDPHAEPTDEMHYGDADVKNADDDCPF
jgi:hypothetical protein